MASGRIVETAYLANIDDLKAKMAEAARLNETAGSSLGNAFDSGSTKAGNAIEKLGQKMQNLGIPLGLSMSKFGSAISKADTKGKALLATMSEIGKVALVGGIAAFAAAAAVGVKGAMDLQKQMEMIHTQAGATQQEVSKMTGAVLGMASSVGTGPQQLAEGLYHVESTGLRGATALNVLRMAAEGAKVGNANLTDVTNALDAAVVSGIPGVQNYSQAMGALNATVGAGDMTMQDLADAMSTGILASAKVFGLSLRDIGAALATLGDNNIRGAAAATRLRMSLSLLGAPSAAAAKALAAVGISSTELGQDMRQGGLIKALEDLKQHLIDSGATATQQAAILSHAFGSGRSSSVIMTLVDQLDRLKQKYVDVGAGANKFGSDWNATTKTFSFQVDQIKYAFESLADKLGGILIPIIDKTTAFLVRNKAALIAVAMVIGGVLASTIGAFVGQSIGRMVGGLAQITSSLFGVGTTSEETAAKVGAADAAMTSTTDAAAANIDAAMLGSGIGAALVALGAAAYLLRDHWKTAWNDIQTVAQDVANFVIDYIINPLISSFDRLVNIITLGIVHLHGELSNISLVRSGSSGNIIAGSVSVPGSGMDTRLPAGTTLAQTQQIQSLLNNGIALSLAIQDILHGGTRNNPKYGPVPVNLYGRKSPGTGMPSGAGSSSVANFLSQGTTSTALTPGELAAEDFARRLTGELQRATSKAAGGSVSAAERIMGRPGQVQSATAIANALANSTNATLVSVGEKLQTAIATAVQMIGLGKAIQVTLKADSINEIAQKLAAQTQAAASAGQAAVGISGLKGQATVDKLNNAAQAITNAAKTMQDAATAEVTAIQAAATIMTDASNAQVTAIQDQTQIQVDTLGERGLYGLQLVAQMAKVALDQQKAADDAKIASDQAHLDQVTAQVNAETAAATLKVDQVTQEQQALVANAQAKSDAVAIQSAIDIAKAQAASDAVSITVAINNAAAQAHADAMMYGTQSQQAQAQAAQKVVNAQSASAQATAQAALTAATNLANSNAQDALNAYDQAQANQAVSVALANSQLTSAQSTGSILIALANAQLAGDQSTAAVLEAKLTSIYNVDQEIANTQFLGTAPFTVNLYGINGDNPTAYADAVGWYFRTNTVT